MTILDAQSKDIRRARTAIMGLMSRGAHIKAFYKRRGQGWGDLHLIIDGQRHEANQVILKGITESGKTTIVGSREAGFVCFHATNLSIRRRAYVNESD